MSRPDSCVVSYSCLVSGGRLDLSVRTSAGKLLCVGSDHDLLIQLKATSQYCIRRYGQLLPTVLRSLSVTIVSPAKSGELIEALLDSGLGWAQG